MQWCCFCYQLGVGLEGGSGVLGLGHVYEGDLDAHPGGDLAEVPVGAAVDVVHGDHVVAGAHQLDNVVGGRQSGREGDGGRRTVKRRQAGLQDVTGWVARTTVLVPKDQQL